MIQTLDKCQFKELNDKLGKIASALERLSECVFTDSDDQEYFRIGQSDGDLK